MDKYTPTELHDIHNMKKRVMNNVNTYVRSHHVKQKRFNWRFATLTTIFTLCIVGYIGYELYYKVNLQDPDQSVIAEPGENNTGVIDAAPFDFTRPNITIDDDKFYIEGVTLGDSLREVRSILGENFTSHFIEDGTWIGSTRIDYDNVVSLYFLNETLIGMLFYVVDENYIKELYEEYNGSKEKTDYQYFIYNEADTQAIKAEKADDVLHVYFIPKHEAPIDFTHPKITVDNNRFTIEGVSIGDSFEKVTSVLGKNYITNTNVDAPTAIDIELVYNNIATFQFYDNELIKVFLLNVNKEYYEEVFKAFNLIKIEEEDMTILYLKESNQSIKAAQMVENKLVLYIGYTGPEFHYSYGEYIQ